MNKMDTLWPKIPIKGEIGSNIIIKYKIIAILLEISDDLNLKAVKLNDGKNKLFFTL